MGTLNHILNGCPVALAQGRYKWRHDKVLRILGEYVDEKRKEINKMPWKSRTWIKFKRAGEKSKSKSTVNPMSFLGTARDWKIQVDVPGSSVIVPSHIAATTQRPDIILTSEAIKQLIIIELTVPVEDRFEISSELKRTKYEDDIKVAAEKKGWRTIIWTVEVGSRGFPAPSMIKLVKEIGFQGRKKKELLKKMSVTAEESSMQIWKSSFFKTWGDA